MSDRKITPGRYFKKRGFCLDHDGSKYTNAYEIYDGDKPCNIYMSDSGDSDVPNSNVRSIIFKGENYATLKEAIFAYEDALKAEA